MAEHNESIVLDLEEQLVNDEKGQERDALRARFEEEKRLVDAKLRAGVSQETFAYLQTLKQGYGAALRMLDDIWRLAHSGAHS